MSIGKEASIEDIKKLKEKLHLFEDNINIPGFNPDSFNAGDCLMDIKISDYNHLVNERDWYEKRMIQYRESFWKVVELIKQNKSKIPENIYNEVIKEDERY